MIDETSFDQIDLSAWEVAALRALNRNRKTQFATVEKCYYPSNSSDRIDRMKNDSNDDRSSA